MPRTPLDTADPLQPKPDSARAPLQPRTLSTVPTRPVCWLWPGRLQFGKLTVLDGGPNDPRGPGWLWPRPEPRRRHDPAADEESAPLTRT